MIIAAGIVTVQAAGSLEFPLLPQQDPLRATTPLLSIMHSAAKSLTRLTLDIPAITGLVHGAIGMFVFDALCMTTGSAAAATDRTTDAGQGRHDHDRS